MTLDEKLTNFTEYCVLAAKKKIRRTYLAAANGFG